MSQLSQKFERVRKLLEVLADGEFHSGESVGEALGVSRAAVWKQLQSLEEYGLHVESVKGKGYRLADCLSLLDEASITAALEEVVHLELCDEIDSTNAEALRRITANALAEPLVIIAERQTGGRGRRGRSWASPFGQNLYFSLAWPWSGEQVSLDGLSLVVGMAVVHALQPFVPNAQLKWPNDILVNNKKLGGILLEISGDPSGQCSVVIGIGLNINMLNSAGAIDQAWTSLRQLKTELIDRNVIAASLINALLPYCQQFEKDGFAAFQHRWADYDAFAGQQAVVNLGQQQVFGIVQGVNERGELLLDVDGEMKSFNSGDVSLRKVL